MTVLIDFRGIMFDIGETVSFSVYTFVAYGIEKIVNNGITSNFDKCVEINALVCRKVEAKSTGKRKLFTLFEEKCSKIIENPFRRTQDDCPTNKWERIVQEYQQSIKSYL